MRYRAKDRGPSKCRRPPPVARNQPNPEACKDLESAAALFEPVTEWCEAAVLTPSPRNSRAHSEKQPHQIAFGIEAFGFTHSFLINAEGQMIACHIQPRRGLCRGRLALRLNGLAAPLCPDRCRPEGRTFR